MAHFVTLDVESLRARAAQFRADAEAMLRTADDIEGHIHFLLQFADPTAPQPSLLNAEAATVRMPAAFMNAGEKRSPMQINHTEGVGKSSRYGIVTGKWLSVLRLLAETAQDEPFDLATAADAVREAQGKDRRLAEIRRQFDPYIEAGYLTKVSPDVYRFTERGFEKAGVARQPRPTEYYDALHENVMAAAVAEDRDEEDSRLLAPDTKPQTID